MATGAELGAELKAAREAAGLTQEQAARELGIATMTLSRWERGVQAVKPRDVAALDRLYSRVKSSARLTRPTERLDTDVPRGTTKPLVGGEAEQYPRHLESAVRLAEAEIFAADLPAAQQDALLFALRNPELVTLYRLGYEERHETVEEQQERMEAHITKVRALLEQMVADLNRQLRRT